METHRSVHIIAEAGTNHGGDIDTARRLVDIAADAKADSVKFQIIYPEGLYVEKLRVDSSWTDNSVIEQRRAMMLEDDEYRLLQQHAGSRAIPLSASVFDTQGLELLNSLQPEYIKIASCDLNNYPFLREASQYGKTLILSTGMANLSEIEKAVDTVKSSSGTDLVLMHCVSVYPCSVERTNLSFVRTLQSAFGVPVGFSDHTESSIAACVAVSMGVQWIEKHFTWSRQAEGFDHAYAMEPSDFGQYVKDIRSVESAMIRPHRKTSKDEENTKCRARRGLFAARQIEQGEVLTEQDVMIVRPETDLAPGDLSLITGRTAKRKIDCCEPLGLDQWE